MHNVQMHAGAMGDLLSGFASVQIIMHSLKIMDYFPVQTHKPYNNLAILNLEKNSRQLHELA